MTGRGISLTELVARASGVVLGCLDPVAALVASMHESR
jgi:hypothetical protein